MLRNASAHTCVENTVCNTLNASIFIQFHHGNPAVMVSAHEQIAVLLIYRHIAPAHTANPFLIDWLQISILQNAKCRHTFICYGI